MRIAVKSATGVQQDNKGRRSHYYPVDLGYDFLGNSASDVTDCATLKMFWSINRIDYKQYRAGLKTYAIAEGFTNLSEADQRTVSEHYCVPDGFISVLPAEEQLAAGANFHRNAVACRIDRIVEVEAMIYASLSESDMVGIVDDLKSTGLHQVYTQFGREGTTEGDAEGLFDYLNSTAGTSYASTGLRTKGISPIGMTAGELADKVLNKLRGKFNI